MLATIARRPASRGAVLVLLIALAGIFSLLLPAPAHAQSASEEGVAVTLGALVHAEASHGWITGGDEERNRTGFGLRRARLMVNARVGPKAGAFFHVSGDGGSYGVLDAWAYYNVNPRIRLRLGRMASAQPRAFILTPVFLMDTIDRAAIALLWPQGTLGACGRDYGFDVRYNTAAFEAILFLHNGSASSNFQPSVLGDVTSGAERSLKDMAVSGYVALRPRGLTGVEVGGYAGYNGSRNPNTAVGDQGRTYVSYAAHAYWGAVPGSQPVRLKADVIGVSYEELSFVPGQRTLGLSGLGAVAVHRAAEVFGRVETYDPGLEGTRDLFVTAGLSFSPSALSGRPYDRERLTLAYNARFPEADGAPAQHLAVLQVQIHL